MITPVHRLISAAGIPAIAGELAWLKTGLAAIAPCLPAPGVKLNATQPIATLTCKPPALPHRVRVCPLDAIMLYG